MTSLDDFLESEDSGSESDIVEKLVRLTAQLDGFQSQLAEAETRVSELKAQIRQIEDKQIPDLLLEAGLKSVQLLDGRTVSTKLYVGAIPAEMKPKAFEWMDKNGHASILKRAVTVQFSKDQSVQAEQAAARLKELGLVPSVTLDLHHQTFSAFAKAQANLGKPLPLADWGVFYGERAVVK